MSDLNLRSGLPAWMRLNGIWRKVTQRPITTDELLAALERLTKNNSVSALIKSGQSDYDFAHEIEESRGVRRRFRGNATPVADGYSTGVKIVFRTIPSMPPALEDLNVEQGILDHAMPSNGLVLVTGVMGSGKSTLLAAILRRIIETGGRNVSTYEAPIEFDFDAVPKPGGPVSQSTIPEHLKSFLTATRNSTRTAPDVVLIGESRDPDTLRGMMESAEIGVAVYSTVHTRSVPETLSRIINVFPFAERLQVASHAAFQSAAGHLATSASPAGQQRTYRPARVSGLYAGDSGNAAGNSAGTSDSENRRPAGRFRSADSGCRPNRLSKRKHHQRKLSGDSGGTQRQGKE